jgi:uncharacterized protein (DUF2249 family)
MTIRIDADTPPPPDRNTDISDAMKKLEVGQSFAIVMTQGQRNGTHIQAKRLGIKVRTAPDEKSRGKKTRVWRIE